jgi:hypothetical protein
LKLREIKNGMGVPTDLGFQYYHAITKLVTLALQVTTQQPNSELAQGALALIAVVRGQR